MNRIIMRLILFSDVNLRNETSCRSSRSLKRSNLTSDIHELMVSARDSRRDSDG